MARETGRWIASRLSLSPLRSEQDRFPEMNKNSSLANFACGRIEQFPDLGTGLLDPLPDLGLPPILILWMSRSRPTWPPSSGRLSASWPSDSAWQQGSSSAKLPSGVQLA